MAVATYYCRNLDCFAAVVACFATVVACFDFVGIACFVEEAVVVTVVIKD